MINYKGYVGKIEFDADAEIFHGEVMNTRDVITFQGRSVTELKRAFKESINDYIEFCESRGEEPEKPFSGRLNLRLSPDLHRLAYLAASKEGMSLNTWFVNTVSRATHYDRRRNSN